jgi:hypothetical protein
MEAQPTTKLGTPASPQWDPQWLARIDTVEKQLGNRICGAHTPAIAPCKPTSNHPNGRCRYHGGHSLIGPPLYFRAAHQSATAP